jgi:predicted Zn-ribbon and HTH transcriptional regulator
LTSWLRKKGEKNMINVICNECGRVWVSPPILGPVACPECKSQNVTVGTKIKIRSLSQTKNRKRLGVIEEA